MRRSIRAWAVAGAFALLAGLVSAPGAAAQTPLADADFTAYATGTVLHADALESGGTRVADVEEAFSGAAADPQGLDAAIFNEMDRKVVPVTDGPYYGRGSGLEIGLGVTPEDDNQAIVAGKAESSDGQVHVEETGPVPAEPLAYAALLRGEAATAAGASDCNLGGNLAHGLGFAADVQLLDADQTANGGPELDEPVVASDAPGPQRAVAQSQSHVRLVPQISEDGQVEGDALGVMSETRMTLAPVTLGGQMTLEFGGEWVLRAVATGKSGSVHYGPGDVSPSTPILRVIDQATQEVTDIVRFQDITGDEGVVVAVEELGIEVAIGEDPRAIGGNADSTITEGATLSSAAVDVVRIRLLDVPGTGTLSDLRVGHMEVRAEAPEDGVTCDLDVSKVSDPTSVTAGDSFTYTITVENPHECTLTNVKVVDEVSATDGVTFAIDGASDGGRVRGDRVVWDDVGPIEPGEKKSVTIDVTVGVGSAAGRVIDDATVTADCAMASADGTTEVEVPVTGRVHLEQPEVDPKAGPAGEPGPDGGPGEEPRPTVEPAGEPAGAPTGDLPRTGGPLPFALAALLLGAAAALRNLEQVMRRMRE